MSDLAIQPMSTDPRREYVAGGARTLQRSARTLPWAIDDLTQDLGDGVYERMLKDAQVQANLTVYKAAVLEDGVTLRPAIADKDADGYEQAAALVPWCEQILDDLETSLDDVCWSLLDALALGSKVAEEVYHDDTTYTGKRQLVLRALKVKPRRATAFVVDPYLNLLGLVGADPARGLTVVTSGSVPTDATLLPREKFCIFTFRPQDGDPRGTTLLRAAYNAYELKIRTWPEYYKYLVQFASPSVWGTTAEHAPEEPDPDDETQTITAVEALLRALLAFQNGTAIALPYGANLELLWSSGDGKAFLEAFSLYDRQITTGMLAQTRATMEATNGSKADSETASDVLATLVRQTRKALARTLRRDVLRDLVRYNYGEAAARLTPIVSFGETEQVDVAPLMTAVAGLQRVSYLDPSQLPDLDVQLGLAARTPEELARRQERAAAPPPAPATPPAADPSADPSERGAQP